MTLIRKRRPGLVGMGVLLLVLGITAVGYFVFQSNTDSNHNAFNQEASVTQPEKNTVVKAEEISEGTVITTSDSEYGSILVDSKRQAIYIWELEKSKLAECYGDCAEVWPPVITSGAPVAAGSIRNELLGTIQRTDGTTQVTYNDHPLYYYAHEKAGEVKCHNIRTHGGLWWVIRPSGVRVE